MIANGTKDPLIRWDGGAIPGQNDRLRPTPQTVAWWVEANRARREPRARQTLPDRDPSDGCRIHLDEYPAGEQPSAPVLFYTMEGGGHTMPSLKYRHPDLPGIRRLIGPTCRDAEGADLAWQFFRRFGR
jgi:poly(3-hydroxybutyrate) depolymerase